MSVEQATNILLRQNLLNHRPLLGSPGLNNEPFEPETGSEAEISTVEGETKERVRRYSEFARNIGSRVMHRTAAPPTQQGSEEFHG